MSSRKKDLISKLNLFYSDLKSYKGWLEHLSESKTILGHQIREKDELRERLVREAGELKPIITELTGKEFIEQLGRVYDMWSTGLTAHPSAPINSFALNSCIDATNEAIGKLESDIGLGIRDKQGNLIEKPQRIDTAKPPKDTGEVPSYLFDRMQFHPRVIEVSESLFKTGNYASAIFEAFKAADNFVKEKTAVSLDGQALMSKVFDENAPIIKLNDLLTRSDRDEQEGFKFMFKGATIGIRNPKAHDNVVQTDPYRTLEYLSFASLLMKRVEEGKVVRLQKHV